uniref:PQRFa peptide receptor 1 n=1 Tax=Branchiostoma japonicum TaxID=373177 RepID=A0A024FLF0_9BRAN|nr:PQRFa peptide receptor 1 [Branchiostoma japonicum]
MDIFNDSTNVTNETLPYFIEKYKHGAGVMSLIILAYVLVFGLCVAGNIIVCVVIIKTPRLRTVTNYLILNLAVSDLLVAVFCMPFTLVEHILTGYQFGDVMCRVTPMIQGVSVAASVFTMTAIAFDRYKAIVFPMKERMTIRMMAQIVVGIWVSGVAIMIPQVFVLKVVTYGPPSGDISVSACIEIWPDTTYKQVYTASLFSLVYVLPLLVISYFYCRVMYKLSATSANQSGHRPNQYAVSRKRVRVLKMLITVVVLFALSWLPLYTCWMLDEFADLSLWQRTIISHYIFPIGHWLAHSNSCVNPIVYGFFNSNIRKNLESRDSRRKVGADTRAKKTSPTTATTKQTNIRRDVIELRPLNAIWTGG